jgi:hypothetical protein
MPEYSNIDVPQYIYQLYVGGRNRSYNNNNDYHCHVPSTYGGFKS